MKKKKMCSSSSVVTVSLCLLLCLPPCLSSDVSQHALGVEVKVYEGAESVLLPCQVTVTDPQFTEVSWSVERLSDKIVHQRVQSGDKLTDQNQDYRGRTSMRTDALRTGDLSLTLKNPTVRDGDTYTCIYREAGLEKRRQEVHLKVKERPPPSSWVVVGPVLVLLAVAAGGLCAYMKWDGVIVQQVEVEEGEKPVLLPFRWTDTWWVKMRMCCICCITADLPGDVRVEWRDKYNRKVHVYCNGSVEQDQVYRDRTEMDEDLMRTGDYSLILKKPRVQDRGGYSCGVYNKDGDLLRGIRVTLKVKEQQVEVEDGAESVLLSFKTTADLPGDVRVEWRDEDNRKVHVYQNGSVKPKEQDQVYRGRTEMKKDLMKTGDYSLILKHPTVADSRVYTCSVYKKDLQRWTRVELKVKGQQVEVKEGKEFVQLPFQTTADLPGDVRVEWTDRENRKVHVYQNGPKEQDQVYRGRTETKKDLMKTGDYSLTLRKPRVRDRGEYICGVYNKDGDLLRERRVDLKVKEKNEPEKTPLMAKV